MAGSDFVSVFLLSTFFSPSSAFFAPNALGTQHAPVVRTAAAGSFCLLHSRKSPSNAHRHAQQHASSAVSLTMKRKNGSGANQRDLKSNKDADDEFAQRRYDRTYEYVQGGFEEKAPPQAAGNQTSMYAAFDRALRASNYNMFCSPLKPVNAPTAFKGQAQTLSSSGKGGEESYESLIKGIQNEEKDKENEEERMKRVEAEYATLNNFLKLENRDGESTRQLKLMNSAAKKFGTKKPAAPASSKKTDQDEKKAPQPLAKLNIQQIGEDNDGSDFYMNDEIEESYDELQRMLGFKPKAGSTRRMNNPIFTGNMTKHREEGMFKAVTLKDPLRRVYAQRLKREPKPVTDALKRPAKEAAPRPHGERNDEAEAEEFLDDILSLQSPTPAPPLAPPPARSSSQSPPSSPPVTPPPRPPKAVKKSEKSQGEKPEEEGEGRLVLNHSTHLPGIIPVLQRLAAIKGINTIVPGRLSRASSNCHKLTLRISTETDTGFKLIARKGTQAQEVFIVGDLEHETLEGAIAWCL